MNPLEGQAHRFWNAARFARRAPDRDQAIAQKVLRDLAQSPHPQMRQRAEEILKGQTHDASTCDR